MRINLGGRINTPEGWLSLDSVPPADIVWDLEDGFPLNVETEGKVEAFRAHHVLEHVYKLCPLMDRLWEALAPGGTLDIEVPHKDHGAAWHDPTHVRYFTELSFEYFTSSLAYFGYVKHAWEYEVSPHMTGANHDFIALTFKKPL